MQIYICICRSVYTYLIHQLSSCLFSHNRQYQEMAQHHHQTILIHPQQQDQNGQDSTFIVSNKMDLPSNVPYSTIHTFTLLSTLRPDKTITTTTAVPTMTNMNIKTPSSTKRPHRHSCENMNPTV